MLCNHHQFIFLKDHSDGYVGSGWWRGKRAKGEADSEAEEIGVARVVAKKMEKEMYF